MTRGGAELEEGVGKKAYRLRYGLITNPKRLMQHCIRCDSLIRTLKLTQGMVAVCAYVVVVIDDHFWGSKFG